MFLTFNFSTISKKKGIRGQDTESSKIHLKNTNEITWEHAVASLKFKKSGFSRLFSIFFFLIPTKKSFGQGTRLFFSFLRFLTLLDLVLGGIGLISWGRYIYTTGQQSHSWVANDLFVSCYPSDLRNLWAVSCYIALGLWFGIP